MDLTLSGTIGIVYLENLRLIENGSWLDESCAKHEPSPHFDKRALEEVSLLVVHNISLPPNEFGGSYISDLFLGKLDPKAHPYFEGIYKLRVSAHCLIKRNGEIIQYVPFDKRAWHAGVSAYKGREKCNDFSIGIELEGADHIPYEEVQYKTLAELTCVLQQRFKLIGNNIVGHCDIAPGRKTDPGGAFDWATYKKLLDIEV